MRRDDPAGLGPAASGAKWRRNTARFRAGVTMARLALAVALVGGWAIGSAAAQDASPAWAMPPDSKLVSSLFFQILRNDRHIGNAHVEVFEADGAWEVRSRTEVFIRLGAATLYDFFQRARETWRDGRLVAYYSKTDDNGVENRVAFKAGTEGTMLIANGTSVVVSDEIAPTSPWHVSMLKRGQFFDPMLGLLHDVTVSEVSKVALKVRGKTTTTKLYAMAGDVERKLWYAPNGTLVQLSLIAPDGSVVLYKLQ